MKSSAEPLGLSLQDLGRQVRQAFFGEEAQRIQRGRDDVRVMVRYPLEERQSLGDVEYMRIRTPDGGQVPFATVANAELGRGFASIKRVDRQRAINVTAKVDDEITNENDVLTDLETRHMAGILAGHPNVDYTFEGMQQVQGEFQDGLQRAFLIAMFVIFSLMAIPFRSYLQPLIVMSAVPFGLVGAVLGHVVMDMEVSFMSMMGMVAVTGVVVNDSLVLVYFVNRYASQNESLKEAVVAAGDVPLPAHSPDFAHHCGRCDAADSRDEYPGAVSGSDGGRPGVGRPVRDARHSHPGPVALPSPGRYPKVLRIQALRQRRGRFRSRRIAGQGDGRVIRGDRAFAFIDVDFHSTDSARHRPMDEAMLDPQAPIPFDGTGGGVDHFRDADAAARRRRGVQALQPSEAQHDAGSAIQARPAGERARRDFL